MRIKANHLVWVAMLAMIFFLARQHYHRVYEDKGRLQIFQSAEHPDTVVFSWSHEVDVPMATRFAEAYAKWRGKARRIVIDLNSPGGSLAEGRKVVSVIENMKKSHDVDTYVGNGRICLSMCVPIYLQGQVRSAAANSRWMFHAPSKVDVFTDEKVDELEFERNYAARRFFNRYFANSDVNPIWLSSIKKQWQGGADIWRTGDELLKQQTNIVQFESASPFDTAK